MRNAFLDTPDDIEWLKETHLKGVPIRADYQGFKCAIMQGNEDAPYAVNLYKDQSPTVNDSFMRVVFVRDGLVYCEVSEVEGEGK